MSYNGNVWMEQEFSDISFGDLRLTSRFKKIMIEFMKKAQHNVSSIFDNWASIKGCYRFLDNTKVKPNIILDEHIKGTVLRIDNDDNTVCILHDTTYIDYKTHTKSQDLDYFTGAGLGKGSLGLILHNSLAVNELGVSLGLTNQKFVERKKIRTESRSVKKHILHKMPIEEKESYRWIEAINNFTKLGCTNNRIVHIADREGDIYELYRDCVELGEKFVIRACRNRTINKKKRREVSKVRLYEHFESLPPCTEKVIEIQTTGDKKYRKAKLSISFEKFILSPPPSRTANKDGENLCNLDLWGVFVKERNPPEGVEGLSWFLITNIPVTSADVAVKKVKYYTLRWNIEIFHKVLKSGCSIESAQLRSREKLIKYITMKSVVAWRIFWMSRNFRDDDGRDCSIILSETEQRILIQRFKKGLSGDKFITAKEAYICIAKLGGYIGRKSDPPPGIMSIWRGWTRFMMMVEDYDLFCG